MKIKMDNYMELLLKTKISRHIFPLKYLKILREALTISREKLMWQIIVCLAQMSFLTFFCKMLFNK